MNMKSPAPSFLLAHYIKNLLIAGAIFAILAAVWVLRSGANPFRSAAPSPIKIGVAQYETPITSAIINGFKDGLKEFGYQENKNVLYVVEMVKRGPEGEAQLRGVIKKQIAGGVDLLYSHIGEVSFLLEETAAAGKPVPIVFTGGANLLERGLIKSFKSSGNNATGVTNNWEDVAAKQLEFLRKIAPNAKRIGIFTDGFIVPDSPAPAFLAEVKRWAPRMGFAIVEYTTDVEPRSAKEAAMKNTLDNLKHGDVDAWMHLPGHYVLTQQHLEAQAGKRLKIPAVMSSPDEVGPDVGGLLSYNLDWYETAKQAARIANKVLKGTKPEDIPIEFPSKNILAINLKTAGEIELTIPDDMLRIAEKLFR